MTSAKNAKQFCVCTKKTLEACTRTLHQEGANITGGLIVYNGNPYHMVQLTHENMSKDITVSHRSRGAIFPPIAKNAKSDVDKRRMQG